MEKDKQKIPQNKLPVDVITSDIHTIYAEMLGLVRTISPLDPEDVVQDTWESFFLYGNNGDFKKIDSPESISSYLKTSVFRRAHDIRNPDIIEQQREKIGLKKKLHEVEEEITDENDRSSPELQVLRREQRNILHNAVDMLPEKYKHVIQLRYFGELSYQEIAKQLGKPIGTIKTQLNRATELLRSRLKEEDFS